MTAEDWRQYEAAANTARERFEPLEDGAVRVDFDSMSYATGRIVVRATCRNCEAASVMQSDGSEAHSRYLAHVLKAYSCRGGETPPCKDGDA